MTTPGPAGLAARALAHRTGLPLIGSLPSSAVADALGGTAGWHHRLGVVPHYMRWLYGTCRKVLVPSADVARRLTGAGWNEHRLIVWPGAVDADAFSPGAGRSGCAMPGTCRSGGQPSCASGTLSRGSGMDLIEPLGSLLHGRRLRTGSSWWAKGRRCPHLQEACPDAVFAGRLSPRDLASVMASADLLFRPAAVETTGLVLLEAQASGLPVLVTGGGSVRDHMRPGLTGLVCRPDDALGLAARAAELLMDPARRRVMGEAARRFAQARLWQQSLERVYALYRSASRTGADGRLPRARARRTSCGQPDEGRAMTLAITVIVCVALLPTNAGLQQYVTSPACITGRDRSFRSRFARDRAALPPPRHDGLRRTRGAHRVDAG